MTAKPTRKQQTRRRRRAVFILLLAAVLCGVGFYCVSVFCRATHIEVTGSTRYAAEDIIEAADIGEEQNIFTISQKGPERANYCPVSLYRVCNAAPPPARYPGAGAA